MFTRCHRRRRRSPVLPLAGALLLALCAPPARAEGDRWKQLRDAARKIKTIQAKFTQTKNLRILKRPLVSKGSFAFAAPDSARWEYREPVRTITLVHEGEVRRYSAGPDGKLQRDAGGELQAMRVVLEQFAGWMAGRFDKSEAFSAKLLPGDPARIVLTPRKEGMARFINKVTLTFAETPGVVERVEVEESKSARTTLVFSEVKVNAGLPEDVFTRVK